MHISVLATREAHWCESQTGFESSWVYKRVPGAVPQALGKALLSHYFRMIDDEITVVVVDRQHNTRLQHAVVG